MKEQWNKDICKQLKGFSKKAPEGLLDNIKSEMHRRGLSPSPVSRNYKYVTILRIASAVAILFILFGISQLRNSSPVIHTEEISLMTSVEENILPVFAETEEQETPPASPPLSKMITQVQQPILSYADTLTTKIDDVLAQTKEEEIPKEKKGKEKEEESKKPHYPKQYKERQKKIFTPTRRKTSSFALDAYYSGLVARVNTATNHEFLDNTREPNFNPSGPSSNTSDSIAAGSRSVSYSQTDNGVKHHIPIRIGMSFRYYLNDRWNIQSGLTYSYLVTDITQYSYQKKQRLHYIGIPIQIGYHIWSSKHFKSYVSAGGQVEKLVSGNLTTHFSDNSSFQNATTEYVNDKRLLFSALASIGAEYTLTPKLSLYVEPGIHYYFKNGNGLQTYYNDQPLNFNVTIGFRFHWKK